MISSTLEQDIIALLHQAKLSPSILAIDQCKNGGNNRTYQIKTKDDSFIVKQYFREAKDQRDRLRAEFSFLTYARSVIPHYVPKAFSQNVEKSIALYEYIDGAALTSEKISEYEINAAIDFFCALNDATKKNEARYLLNASDACFSLAEHIELIELRIKTLTDAISTSKEDNEAVDVVNKLKTYWQVLTQQIKQIAKLENIDLTKELTEDARCISPSDFGFHNALKKADGSICFLDFEYAGWDDPAKMVGDFFSQVAIPVSSHYFAHFVQEVMRPFSKVDHLIKRATLLRAVYQIKWCCIVLNIFLPVHLARRQFAHPELDVNQLKKAQLTKVKTLFKNLESFIHG